MGEGLQYIDIVLLALVAGFIVLRLRGTLGRRTGFDGSQDPEKPQEREVDAGQGVIRLPRPQLPAPDPEEIAGQIQPSARPAIERIIAEDPSFSVPEFLAGARTAFEMVIEAFNKEDRAALGPLLSQEVKAAFDETFEGRRRTDRHPETTLVAISSQKITEASLSGAQARITVQFVTEQINLVRDAKGEVLEGDPSRVDNVTAEWSFERNLTSRNPNWTITAT